MIEGGPEIHGAATPRRAARQDDLDDAADVAERATQRLALLQDVVSALARAHTQGEVAEAVASRIRPALGARLVTVRLLTEGACTLETVLQGEDAGGPCRPSSTPLDADVPLAEAVRGRAGVWLRTPEELAERDPECAELVATGGIRAGAALPMCVGERCLGALGLLFDAPRSFDEEERAFVRSIADQCAQALDRVRLLEAERGARRRAEQALAQLDAIVANAPLGVAFLDRDMRYRRVNRSLAELNGIAMEDHLGRTPRELFPGLPVDALEAQFRDVLATGAPLVDVEISGEGRAEPGRRRVTLASWYPVRVSGEVHGVGVLVREVTAERDAQEFQRHVLAVVGHDLRNPLSAIHGLAALLRRRGGDAAPPLLDRLQYSAQRMEGIIRDLLDYANVRRGVGVPMAPRPCDVAEICRAIALECEAAHPGREVRVGGAGSTACTWDPERVAQLLGNLVGNALRHGEQGGVVEVRWSGGEHDVAIAVANRGAPIPPSVVARMFEPFERGGGGGSGLGLGLFIARQIALAHGGRIDVRSSAEDGTVFTVVLPRRGPAR
jgi:PAS domain S-box-containing protein